MIFPVPGPRSRTVPVRSSGSRRLASPTCCIRAARVAAVIERVFNDVTQ